MEFLVLLKFFVLKEKEKVIDNAILFRFSDRRIYNTINCAIFMWFYTHMLSLLFYGVAHIERAYYGFDLTWISNPDDDF